MSVRERFDDRLEPIGIFLGIFLVLIGLATIAGSPWATKGDAIAAGIQVLAALAAVGIGAALVWISRLE